MKTNELLRRYVDDRSEAAFAELVRQNVDLVYSSALRQVNGDIPAAQDITQAVFTDLARKAPRLTSHASLAGWLYTSTRFLAAKARRAEQRRRSYEKEAHEMNQILQPAESGAVWQELRPLLDDAMHNLSPTDCEAVLMRYFEHLSLAEIGERMGIEENAAHMRINRAVTRLREVLAKRGVRSTDTALALALTANAVSAAPTGLAANVVRVSAAAGLGGRGIAAGLARVGGVKLVAAAGMVALGVGAAVHLGSTHGPIKAESATNVSASSSIAQSNATGGAALVMTNLVGAPHRHVWTNGLTLHLEIATSDTGKPVPRVAVELDGWRGDRSEAYSDDFVSDPEGHCDVFYAGDTTILMLRTRKDVFADTRLLWRPSRGDEIPASYLLRLDKAATIGGQVVGPDGEPVAGATVSWNQREDQVQPVSLPQSHLFGSEEAMTDEDGRWTLRRVADDVVFTINGNASHSNYLDSTVLSANTKEVERQLRDGTAVFRLRRAVTVTGIVVNGDGAPVSGAAVLVGRDGIDGSEKGITGSDGTFSIAGCDPDPNMGLVTATADGYPATTVVTNLELGAPVRLTLAPGRTVQLHVIDASGSPVAGANVFYQSVDSGVTIGTNGARPGSVSPQTDFQARADDQGDVVWTNAPLGPLRFGINAPGRFSTWGDVAADVAEQTVTLWSGLVVHGTVTDAKTGLPISKFRIGEGNPEWSPMAGTMTWSTNAIWSPIARYWKDFTDGAYSNFFNEPLHYGVKNKGYFLKFVADGYAPYVSRLVGPDEGNVELDVTLQPAASVTVQVLTPGGAAARWADVGLVSQGSRLTVHWDGFDWSNPQMQGSLLKTDANGLFTLAPDPAIRRVVIAGADGFAETTPGQLAQNPTITLQPWGVLEVTCQRDGKPAAGSEYRMELGDGNYETVSFDTFESQKSGEQGRITFRHAPPGHHQLVHVRTERHGEQMSMQNGPATPVDIQPGRTNTVVVEDQLLPEPPWAHLQGY